MPILTARKIGSPCFLEKSLSAVCRRSSSIDSTISCNCCGGFISPVRSSTERASCRRPFLTSQRGLLGIENNITKNSTAGMAATPSSNHHYKLPRWHSEIEEVYH